MIGGIGIPELLIILVIVLLIFGAGKLPQIGGNIGKAIKNFKGGIKEEEEELESSKREAIDDKPRGESASQASGQEREEEKTRA